MDPKERTRKTAIAFGVIIVILVSGIAASWIEYYYKQLNVTRVACVGDSITMGSTYTKQLQEKLGYNYSVGNFGLSGATVARDARIPYIYQLQFLNAIQFNPDIVLIMLGTNDANPEIAYNETTFTEDYSYIVNSFLNLDSNPQVVVVDSPKMFVSPSSAYNDSYLLNNVIPQIEYVADQQDLVSVDLYHAFAEHPDYYMDGVHPNEQGSTLIADSMYSVVTSIAQADDQP
jgi:lysophospholipase L1-like esterase